MGVRDLLFGPFTENDVLQYAEAYSTSPHEVAAILIECVYDCCRARRDLLLSRSPFYEGLSCKGTDHRIEKFLEEVQIMKRFIDPIHRFRERNILNDDRIPQLVRENMLWMVDSTPVGVPRQKGTIGRQYWCEYHKMQCVKFTVGITHEDIAVLVGEEVRGGENDKADFHNVAHNVLHFKDLDFVCADTAYSSAPHVFCKYEHPLTNREMHWNAVMQIVRQRVEKYFAWMKNNFKAFRHTDMYLRDRKSRLAKMVSFVCDLRNMTILRDHPSSYRVPSGELCTCCFGDLTPQEKKERNKQLAAERYRRKKRRREEIAQGYERWKGLPPDATPATPPAT